MPLSASLRKAVEAAVKEGETRYSVAKGAGVDYSVLVRWLDEGRDIRLSTVDQIAEYLGLDLTAIKKSGASKSNSGKS